MELQMFCCLLGYTVLYWSVRGLSKPLCLFVSSIPFITIIMTNNR
uniref:Uncharacterized protein n=1 Tax=Meloidogyne enterolobii TaxID=390850 RepID=A0A6V7UMD4_MELEN|nr:unnamed protein product [Meloidogyne enterolobii]